MLRFNLHGNKLEVYWVFQKRKTCFKVGGGCLDKFSSGSLWLYNFEIFLRAYVMAMFYNYVTFMYSIVHQIGI